MGMFSWLRKSSEPTTLNWEQLRDLLSGGQTKSGRAVNHMAALRVTSVLGCARLITNGFSQVPFRLMKTEGRNKQPATDHPLWYLTVWRPNQWQTSFAFRQQIGLHLALTNNAYIFKVKSDAGKTLEWLPIQPSHIACKRNDDMSLTYRIQLVNGKFIDADESLIWHIRNLTWDGINGLDAVRLVREAIGLTLSAEEHGNNFFANGAKVAGVLTSAQKLDKPAMQALRESWEATYSGTSNAFRTAVLGNDLKYQPIGQQADQAQYNETRRQQVEEICRGFGVLPIMLGFADKTMSFASAESMMQAHVTYTMMPIYANFEQSAAVNTLTEDELRGGHYYKLFANGLLRGNTKDRGEYYAKMFSVGALNPNGIRELEDMNPYDGGDEYFVPMNMTPPNAAENVDSPPNEDKPT